MRSARQKIRTCGHRILCILPKVVGLSSGLLLFASLFPSLGAAQDRYQEIHIPAGAAFQFPTPAPQLINIRNTQDLRKMRLHAWAIFAGLTRPSDPGNTASAAIWETWYTRSETFKPQSGCEPTYTGREIHREFELPLELVAAFQSENTKERLAKAFRFFADPGKSVISNVLYNASACEHIKQVALPGFLKSQFDKLTSIKAPASEREIQPFPRRAIVVKAIWQLVNKHGTTSLEVWDSPDIGHARSVEIEPAKGRECNLPVSGNEPVRTSCFYSIPVTSRNLREIKRARTAECGDVLVLVGLHVITKELPDWTWSTFWWNTKPNASPYGMDRPGSSIITGYWRNYLMDTTLSMETPWENNVRTGAPPSPATDSCGQNVDGPSAAKICLNPYLERVEQMVNADVSNCMNCHKRSTYKALQPDLRGSPRRGYLGSDNSCFGETMRLDYLWTLSPPEENTDLSEFIKALRSQLKLE